MFGYGFLILALSAVTIGAFLLGLLFLGRLRLVRLILWVVAGIFLFLAVCTPIQHYFNNKADSKALLGTYYLDQTKSDYSPDSLVKYSDLILTVRDDNTFELSKSTSMFPNTTGKWTYDDDGDLVCIKCDFDSTNPFCSVHGAQGEWKFEASGWNRKCETIVFTRIEQIRY